MIAPSTTCFCCDGTGACVWRQAYGKQCPCVTCSECSARATVWIDEETGEKLCAECVAFRAEEAAMGAGAVA